MKFYGYKKCSTVKKAKKWLVENVRGLGYLWTEKVNKK